MGPIESALVDMVEMGDWVGYRNGTVLDGMEIFELISANWNNFLEMELGGALAYSGYRELRDSITREFGITFIQDGRWDDEITA